MGWSQKPSLKRYYLSEDLKDMKEQARGIARGRVF